MWVIFFDSIILFFNIKELFFLRGGGEMAVPREKVTKWEGDPSPRCGHRAVF